MRHLEFSTKIILGLAVIALTVAYFSLPWGELFQSPKQPQLNQVGCTKEARTCPDSSSVGRVPPRCEFAPCPSQVSESAQTGYVLATTWNNSSVMTLSMFDLENGTMVTSTKVEFDGALIGANDAVQFNKDTQQAYYVTNGTSDYDGRCINSDGSCTSRLWRLAWGKTQPTMLYETSDRIGAQWLFLSHDHSIILLQASSTNTERFVKIDTNSGETIFATDYLPFKARFENLQLSPDKKSVQQIMVVEDSAVPPSQRYSTVMVRQLNLTNGTIATNQVLRTKHSISSINTTRDAEITIMSFWGKSGFWISSNGSQPNSVPNTDGLKNGTPWLSADGSRLYYVLNDRTSYYSFADGQTYDLPGEAVHAAYLHHDLVPSTFIVYSTLANGKRVYYSLNLSSGVSIRLALPLDTPNTNLAGLYSF